jgi:hypothetical protein
MPPHEQPPSGVGWHICGIDFTRPFPKYGDDEYMLVQVNYVSKWVEAISSQLQALQEDVP